MDAVTLFQAGSGGIGNFAAGVEALVFVLVVLYAAWVVMTSVREATDIGSVSPVVQGVIRSAVVVGLAGAVFLLV